jgi:cytochrome P450
MIAELVIFFVCLFISYFIWQRWQELKLRDRLGIPGPKPNFITGNMNSIMGATDKDHPMMSILSEWRKKYGNFFGYYLGPKLIVVVADMDLAKEVLIKQFDCFTDRMMFVLSDRNVVKDSLIHLQSDNWKHIRNTITPTFTASKMKQMSSIIDEKIDTMISKLDSLADKKATFDIYDSFQALTLDVIGQCAFALKVNCQTDPNDPFMFHGQQFFREADIKRDKLLTLAVLFPEFDKFWTMFRSFTKFGHHEQWLIDVLRKVVNERRKNYKANESVDYLQLLFEQQKQEESETAKNGAQKWSLTDDAVLGNAFVFLLAGYETTSTALGFTAWLLAKHRDVQDRLQKEIDEKVTDKNVVNYDLLHKLPYLDAVYHEALRVYPPVVQFLTRTCVKECDVGPIHFVPGVQVNVPTSEIHNDPDVWPEPEKFDPDRFLNSTFPVMSWLPFGVGPRNCVGMRFADMEYKMALVRILQKFNIVLGPDSEDPLKTMENAVMLRPKNGVQIRVEKRK